MFRFFVKEAAREGIIRISGSDVNHIRNVLRMSAGEEITAVDPAGREYVCRLADMEPQAVTAEIIRELEGSNELPASIFLFQGLPKGDKMELIVQKAVELGCAGVIPVSTKRAVVKLDEKKAVKKQQRWNAIAESAAKQAKRSLIPAVEPVCTFQQALQQAESLDVCLIPYELETDMQRTKALIAGLQPGSRIGIFIGPEGGFAEAEVAAASEAGVMPVTLGKRILRTETAGFTMLSILMYHFS